MFEPHDDAFGVEFPLSAPPVLLDSEIVDEEVHMLFPALAASRGMVKKQMVKECLGMFDMFTEKNDDYKETLETTRLEMFANFAEKTGDFKKLYDQFGQFTSEHLSRLPHCNCIAE